MSSFGHRVQPIQPTLTRMTSNAIYYGICIGIGLVVGLLIG